MKFLVTRLNSCFANFTGQAQWNICCTNSTGQAGGAGFIGSNIVEELLKRNYSVRVLDNFATGKREYLCSFEKDIELIEGDIRSYHTVIQSIKGIDIVLHQAALPSVPRSINDPLTTNDVNVGGTLNILDAAKEAGVKRVDYPVK